MARIRNIKPDFWKDEDLAAIPIEARYLFAGLLTQADREGRLEYRPRRIKVELMPYDNVDIEALCRLLDHPTIPGRPEKRFIIIYEVAGEQYLQIVNFHKHQRPHHAEKPSTIPAYKDNTLKTDKTCESASIDAPLTASAATKPLESGILNLEQLNNGASRVTPVQPEPADLASHSWGRFLAVMPLREGRCLQESECRAEWDRWPSRWTQWISAARNYAASRDAQNGYVMSVLKFLRHRWEDYLEPVGEPSGQPPPDTGWQAEAEADQRHIEQNAEAIAAAREKALMQVRGRLKVEG